MKLKLSHISVILVIDGRPEQIQQEFVNRIDDGAHATHYAAYVQQYIGDPGVRDFLMNTYREFIREVLQTPDWCLNARIELRGGYMLLCCHTALVDVEFAPNPFRGGTHEYHN